jgi:porphobilinogen synthase
MLIRPRRLRKSKSVSNLVAETQLSASDFIYPIFIQEGSENTEIKSMPGIYRLGIESIEYEVEEFMSLGIQAVAIFPVIDPELKSWTATEALNPNSLNQRAIKLLKSKFSELIVVSDIALDPYTLHGHDGLISPDGTYILNDETLKIISRMALLQAEAGSDILAPSEMMDGRVRVIREVLEEKNFTNTLIMSYTAKYASSLYGPFRDALGSLGSEETKKELEEMKLPKDKSTYQMNPANQREALKELALDIKESADIVMVKPASWYLDVISKFKERSNIPIAAYQVSGEYSMIKFASMNGVMDYQSAVHESLISIKRAGADLIISYFVKDYLKSLSPRSSVG